MLTAGKFNQQIWSTDSWSVPKLEEKRRALKTWKALLGKRGSWEGSNLVTPAILHRTSLTTIYRSWTARKFSHMCMLVDRNLVLPVQHSILHSSGELTNHNTLLPQGQTWDSDLASHPLGSRDWYRVGTCLSRARVLF